MILCVQCTLYGQMHVDTYLTIPIQHPITDLSPI